MGSKNKDIFIGTLFKWAVCGEGTALRDKSIGCNGNIYTALKLLYS